MCSDLDMDVDQFSASAEQWRHELHVHCYRMLGSVHDADDLVQETMLRALNARDRYDPSRASMRTWLYRIATNACLNAIAGRGRRPLPSGIGPAFDDADAPLTPGLEVPWLQPLPTDPEASAIERNQVRLALVAAIQLLPPRQRAALLLRDVLGLSAVDIAEQLQTTTAAVNSALQRARARLDSSGVDIDAQPEASAEQRFVVDRYAAAFERADVDAIRALLSDDAILEMPPMWNWYAGADQYMRFMARVFRLRGTAWTTVPLWANGHAGFAAHLDGALHTVQIFTTHRGRIERASVFQDEVVFDLFSLPR